MTAGRFVRLRGEITVEVHESTSVDAADCVFCGMKPHAAVGHLRRMLNAGESPVVCTECSESLAREVNAQLARRPS